MSYIVLTAAQYGDVQHGCPPSLVPSSLDSLPPPPSVALNALRHWSFEELALLSGGGGAAGALAIASSKSQTNRWLEYLPADTAPIPTQWWLWFLEAVHSRAFFTKTRTPSPLVKAGIALQALSLLTAATHLNSEAFLLPSIALFTVDFVPPAFSLRAPTTLLPLIDSANHAFNATAAFVTFDPIKASYTLTIDESCVDSEKQVFITYESRNDKNDGRDTDSMGLLVDFGIVEGAGRREEMVRNFCST